ncbi:hypothetical protein WN944_001214 [Citrus x changshan-huyou]|uniref:Uncharacterized protein n=1 Tax=Citrus x changshan-huyou TaxID=2935761 RepID=A0AAP0MFZ1_9ROSI
MGPRVPQSRYSGYTLLSVPREQLLMQIRDLDLLRKPKEIRTVPNKEAEANTVGIIEIMIIIPTTALILNKK